MAPDEVTFEEVVDVVGQWCGEITREILPPAEQFQPEQFPMLECVAPDDLLSTEI